MKGVGVTFQKVTHEAVIEAETPRGGGRGRHDPISLLAVPESRSAEVDAEVDALHLFDCLRANKATMAHGLEARRISIRM